MALCALYYWVWIYLLPRLGDYSIRQTIIEVPGGGFSHALVKVPNSELQQWDDSHDPSGNVIGAVPSVESLDNDVPSKVV